MHLNAVAWGQPILPGESRPSDLPQLIKDLGFDSTTSYVWIHHVPLPRLQTDYNEVRDAYNAFWERATNLHGIPYFPNVSMGWDSSPRANQAVIWRRSGTSSVANWRAESDRLDVDTLCPMRQSN